MGLVQPQPTASQQLRLQQLLATNIAREFVEVTERDIPHSPRGKDARDWQLFRAAVFAAIDIDPDNLEFDLVLRKKPEQRQYMFNAFLEKVRNSAASSS